MIITDVGNIQIYPTILLIPIRFCSNKYHILELSTLEAEYIPAIHSLRNLLWFRILFTAFISTRYITPLSNQFLPTPLRIYNRIPINMAQYNRKPKRRKYVFLKHHYLHHHHKKCSIYLIHIQGLSNPIYALTNSLAKTNFLTHTIVYQGRENNRDHQPTNISFLVHQVIPESHALHIQNLCVNIVLKQVTLISCHSIHWSLILSLYSTCFDTTVLPRY